MNETRWITENKDQSWRKTEWNKNNEDSGENSHLTKERNEWTNVWAKQSYSIENEKELLGEKK